MLPSTRPASFTVHSDALHDGPEDLCCDCHGALKRRGVLRVSVRALFLADVVRTEPATQGAVCTWCE